MQPTRELEELYNKNSECYKCAIRCIGHNTVFGCGDPNADLMILGEAPGYQEHIDGIPFTGKAGKLLDRILSIGMGISRDEVYLANVLKCRPPENRDPTHEEIANCSPWLDEQVKLVDPKVILTLGKFSSCFALSLDHSKTSMGSLRGSYYKVNNRLVVPTWHPAYILRNPGKKPDVQNDINIALELLGKPIIHQT